MFRFTIREVLWLMVVVALGVALALEHRRFAALDAAFQAQKAELQAAQADMRLAQLRVKELRREVVLPASPDVLIRSLERRGWEGPRAIDAP